MATATPSNPGAFPQGSIPGTALHVPTYALPGGDTGVTLNPDVYYPSLTLGAGPVDGDASELPGRAAEDFKVARPDTPVGRFGLERSEGHVSH